MKLKRELLISVALATFASGCHQEMWVQPKAKAQLKNEGIFDDKSNSRQPVMGTVAYDSARLDREFYTGYDSNGRLVKEFPIAVTEETLKRGQDRFRIFCTPCHGELGNGKGFIAQRGFTMARPVGNYHSDRLRNMPVGHFFDVMTNGFGVMYPFRSRIQPYDRWAIASYIRVLQESQHQPVFSLPQEEQAKLQSMNHEPSQDAPLEQPINRGSNRAEPGQPVVPEPGAMTEKTVPIGRRPVSGARSLRSDSTTMPGGQDAIAPMRKN